MLHKSNPQLGPLSTTSEPPKVAPVPVPMPPIASVAPAMPSQPVAPPANDWVPPQPRPVPVSAPHPPGIPNQFMGKELILHSLYSHINFVSVLAKDGLNLLLNAK